MAWRIHFTAEDLERIQVSPTLGPLGETVMAMGLLRCGKQQSALFGPWRGQVTGRLTPQMAPLTALIPPDCKGVDLCMLTGAAATIEQGVQALMAMPAGHVLTEMEYIDRMHKLPAAVWAVAEADGPARHQLAIATQAAYRALVEPYWPRIRACLHAERVTRGKILASGGPGGLLASLQDRWIRWRPPVLEVLVPGCTEVHLDGRGIVLVPSVFVGEIPSLHLNPNDPAAAPWLILPPADDRVDRRRLWDKPRPRGAALAALVGQNRAAVLSAIAHGCTTTELAGRVGISLAAASQHASVLRNAGLITTRRQGSAVLHVLTPLGAELLRAG
jgi:DNA-binding transcriptional ArsR family regulator